VTFRPPCTCCSTSSCGSSPNGIHAGSAAVQASAAPHSDFSRKRRREVGRRSEPAGESGLEVSFMIASSCPDGERRSGLVDDEATTRSDPCSASRLSGADKTAGRFLRLANASANRALVERVSAYRTDFSGELIAASSNDPLHAMPRQAGLLGVNAAVWWLRRQGTDRRDRRLESVVMGRVVQIISALRGNDFGVAQICAATFSRPIMRASVRTSSF
jgi:hypothetical protein